MERIFGDDELRDMFATLTRGLDDEDLSLEPPPDCALDRVELGARSSDDAMDLAERLRRFAFRGD
jgi:hypothetical protein